MSCDIMVRFNYVQQEQLLELKTAYEAEMRRQIKQFADSYEEAGELLEESMTDHELFDEFMASLEDPDLIKIRAAIMYGRPLTPVDRIRIAKSPRLALGPVETMTFDQLKEQITYRPPATVDRVQQAADARTAEYDEMMTEEEQAEKYAEETALQQDAEERQVVAVDPKVPVGPSAVQEITPGIPNVWGGSNRWGEWGSSEGPSYFPPGEWGDVRVVSQQKFNEAQKALLKATFELTKDEALRKEVKADPRLLASNGERIQFLSARGDRYYLIYDRKGVPRFCDAETGVVKNIVDMAFTQDQVEVSAFGSYDRDFMTTGQRITFKFTDGTRFDLPYY